MIKKWIVTGDTHGRVNDRILAMFENYKIEKPEETGVIILGDAGFNYYLNKTDAKNKKIVNDHGIYIYCVRGNHEERPRNIESMQMILDENVQNLVYYEPEYPFIRYFLDGAVYRLTDGEQEYRTLVIGGAYSVDKWFRIKSIIASSPGLSDETNVPGWFCEEQLSEDEMFTISQWWYGKQVDLILTHTCPLSWQPTDLFLRGLDQSTVDNSMEVWLDELKDEVKWDIWLFGHYHDDRLVRPHVEMFYTDYEWLSSIVARWAPDAELACGLKKTLIIL
jgi:3-oxoacid CoA-transferase subunit A